MTKARTGPLDDDDIVTPSAQADAASHSHSGQANSGLRMPPIIDLSPSLLQRFVNGAKALLRGTLYQVSLIGLLLMALGLMVLTLMEAGNIAVPDWRQWVASIDATRPAPSDTAIMATPQVENQNAPDNKTDNLAPDNLAPDNLADDETIFPEAGDEPLMPALGQPITETAANETPETEAHDLPMREVPAIEDTPDNGAPMPAIGLPALDTEIAALRQTLADTRRALAEAQAALLEKQTSNRGAAVAQLTKRAAMADLLLRLDDGAPFDDVLDGGQLDDVLSKQELSALALHAARGVPTEAGIKAQAETLPLIIGAAAGGSGDRLPAIFIWLAEKAPKLIAIRETPMAGAQKQLRLLYEQLQARDYRAAAATTRLLVLTYGEDTRDQTREGDAALALQALYADLRAFSETSIVRTDLRRDYMAGVRP